MGLLLSPPFFVLEHAILVAAGLLTYVLVTRIGQQRRHPSAAIAWVVAIAAFPYMAVPLFLLLGTRKFVRPAPPVSTRDPLRPTPGKPQWATRLLGGLGLAEPVQNLSVSFHVNGIQSYRALIDLFGQAQHSLEVCTFILGDDEIGNSVADALVAAVGRGVRVRLLIDWVGSLKTSRKMRSHLRHGGVQLRLFMPLLHNPMHGRTNLRNHRKLVIADSYSVWSGGRNLADEYFFDRVDQPAWLDLTFVVEGPLAAQAQAQFDQDWMMASGGTDGTVPPTPRAAVETDQASALAQWIPCGPDRAEDTVHALLMAGSYHARGRILAVTPYFVPDDALLEAWCMACRRGVQVRLVIPLKSNHRMADWARERALRRLVDSGGQVFMTRTMIHAKAVVVDSAMALCGSVNLDGRSLFLNFEVMTAFYSPPEVTSVAAWIEGQTQEAIAYQAQRPPWWRDLLEGVIRAVGFQL